MSCSHHSGCSLCHARRLPWVGNGQNDMFTNNPVSCAWRWWCTGHFLGHWGWQVEELVWLEVWAWQKSFGPANQKTCNWEAFCRYMLCAWLLSVCFPDHDWDFTTSLQLSFGLTFEKACASHPKIVCFYFVCFILRKICYSISWQPTHRVIWYYPSQSCPQDHIRLTELHPPPAPELGVQLLTR